VDSNGRKDATVRPPTAHIGVGTGVPTQIGGASFPEPSPEELCRVYYAAVKQKESELKQLGDATTAISSMALCMLRRLLDLNEGTGRNTVTIHRSEFLRTLGASIKWTELPNGDIEIQLREAGPERIVAE